MLNARVGKRNDSAFGLRRKKLVHSVSMSLALCQIFKITKVIMPWDTAYATDKDDPRHKVML